MRTSGIAAALATTILGIGAAQAQTADQPNPDVQGTTTVTVQQLRTPSVSEQTVTSLQNSVLQFVLSLQNLNQALFEESFGRSRPSGGSQSSTPGGQ